MKARIRLVSLLGVAAVAALAMTVQLTAQNNPNHHLQQYRLAQVGTFGGPNSDFFTGPGNASGNQLNSQGASVGGAQTNTTDPFSPNCIWSNCLVGDALTFQNGSLTDLGALPGTNNSFSYGINDFGLVVGVSENGSIDPATGYPEYHAVVWRNGAIRDLGTLGGSVSQAFAVNDWGQVVGVATNAVPDQYSSGLGPCTTVNCWPVATEQRAIWWDGGELQDLGTLGGNDAVANFVNWFGQIAGVSYTNTTPNPTTGLPTQDPFLWDPISRRMVDLGSLGGTYSVVYWLNNLGQVAGYSNLVGDQTFHAFLWDPNTRRMTDLGTLGGDAALAVSVNDAGAVVGDSLTSNGQTHGFVWQRGTITDLGTLPGDVLSNASAINLAGAIVGQSCNSDTCEGLSRAVLWENGSMVDLNTLVTPPSNLHLHYGYNIADSGEILAYGTLPNGDVRIAVLTPMGDCDSDCEQRITEAQNHPAAQPATMSTTTPVFGKSGNSLMSAGGLLLASPK